MPSKDFVHLHLHTEYSLLDGFARINEIVPYAKDLGMEHLAISDHGTMFGVIDFYRKCKEAEINPVIGVEAYLATRRHTDRDSKLDQKPYHLLLLAKNNVGYQNLLRLSSIAQLEGYYYRPRIDKQLLEKYSEGLIATSGCLGAEIPRLYEQGEEDKALETLDWYREVFGDDFYLELQWHGIPELDRLNPWLIEVAKQTGTPLVATNDVHYVRPEDFEPHDTLLAIQTSSSKADPGRSMKMTGNTYYLRNQAEMWSFFEDTPEALYNTLRIAEQCEVNLDAKDYHLPLFPVPPAFKNEKGEEAPEKYLRYLCEKGLRWRYGENALYEDKYYERLNFELNVIHKMGFDTYFLIVWDLCQFARYADIWWNVRGSGAGSVVAYTLGITNLDPLENGLLFERFLNPGRVSMPDFDIDYPEDQRMRMIEYCVRKYGEDKVAAIITFGTMGAKGAIRDVGRALDVPLPEVDAIARTIPTGAKLPSIKQMIGDDPDYMNADLKAIYDNDRQNGIIRQIIDTAKIVEGVPRHASTHAAGIIVADKPLMEYLPLHRPTKGDSDDSPVKLVTQFPMETAESIGLLKIDFLGLSTLTILRRACKLIEQYHGHVYDMSNIPYKPDPRDPKLTRRVEQMFEMIGEGHTVGVFQVESSGMRQMLRDMRPKTFEHITAAISLYRPGPMDYIPTFNRRMHGDESVEYHHKKLIPILENTYGIMVYQEQLMQIGAELFGYSLAEADLMRRAVSKKKQADLQKHRAIFLERGPENGIPEAAAGKIFDDIEFFANYGFNKSHAADYAVITCQTAYLKCHYPHEYMAALMSVYFDDSGKVSQFVVDCQRLNIDVLPPDVNSSEADFTIKEQADGSRAIRFGLGAIKNLGGMAIQYIIQQRGDEPFKDLDDFLKRCLMKDVGKRGLEALIRVDALGCFGYDRTLLLANLDRLMAYSLDQYKQASSGQKSLFDLMEGEAAAAGSVRAVLVDSPPREWDFREQLRWEKDLTGVYISDHPLKEAWPKLALAISHEIAELQAEPESFKGKQVKVAALVTEVRRLFTRRDGKPMGSVTFEDMTGSMSGVIFHENWLNLADEIEVDKILVFRGEVDLRDSGVQIKISEIIKWHIHTTAEDSPRYMMEGEGLTGQGSQDLSKTSQSASVVSAPNPNTHNGARPEPKPSYNGFGQDVKMEVDSPNGWDGAPDSKLNAEADLSGHGSEDIPQPSQMNQVDSGQWVEAKQTRQDSQGDSIIRRAAQNIAGNRKFSVLQNTAKKSSKISFEGVPQVPKPLVGSDQACEEEGRGQRGIEPIQQRILVMLRPDVDVLLEDENITKLMLRALTYPGIDVLMVCQEQISGELKLIKGGKEGIELTPDVQQIFSASGLVRRIIIEPMLRD